MANAKSQAELQKGLTSDDVKVTEELIPIFIMGKRYDVPKSLTIQKALEYAGYFLIRGCGCRAGICGACATVYRLPNNYKVEIGIACQTLVVPNMYIAQIPFFPAIKAKYNVEELKVGTYTLGEVYPELYKCMGCNTCTRSCPMDIQVMEYVAAAIRGDIKKCAELSFSCIMCGLCAARCPAEIVQYNAAMLSRRLAAKYLTPPAKHLEKTLELLQKKVFEKDLDEIQKLDEKELRKAYSEREIEPIETEEFWKPKDRKHLVPIEVVED